MWTKLENPEVFFRARNGEKRMEPILSFADGTGNFCHLALENGFYSLWRTVASDVNQGAAFVRYERMVEWPKEVLNFDDGELSHRIAELEESIDHRLDVIKVLGEEKAELTDRVAELEAHNERLTSEKFSERNHIALQSRAESAEARVKELEAELQPQFVVNPVNLWWPTAKIYHERLYAATGKPDRIESPDPFDPRTQEFNSLWEKEDLEGIFRLFFGNDFNKDVFDSMFSKSEKDKESDHMVEKAPETLHPERKNAGKRGKKKN